MIKLEEMSLIFKSVSLRVPSDVIYRSLKDRRLERLFPEFFTGVTRTLSGDKKNNEVEFTTMTNDGQFQIKETFKLKISSEDSTEITYRTETNVQGDLVANSIVLTHIANILYALLMLETGYINGLTRKEK
ncbi:MAG TPA: hypothetical protein VFI70_01660 [Nitrososphaeraceae archaeon]|jgi:hypothetical protein|nr:hypothetical protein [Nitrososphaeraceae archaeon]